MGESEWGYLVTSTNNYDRRPTASSSSLSSSSTKCWLSEQERRGVEWWIVPTSFPSRYEAGLVQRTTLCTVCAVHPRRLYKASSGSIIPTERCGRIAHHIVRTAPSSNRAANKTSRQARSPSGVVSRTGNDATAEPSVSPVFRGCPPTGRQAASDAMVLVSAEALETTVRHYS